MCSLIHGLLGMFMLNLFIGIEETGIYRRRIRSLIYRAHRYLEVRRREIPQDKTFGGAPESNCIWTFVLKKLDK